MVKLVPYVKEDKDDFMKYFGFLKGDENGVSYENKIRRSIKEKRYLSRY